MSELSWSDEQHAIFNWFQSGSTHLVVQARAGTGKTTTIKEAFRYAPESNMLYAVFNKKNAVEAQSKIADSRVTIKTLHALGFSYVVSMWPGVRPEQLVERDRVCGTSNLPCEVVTQACKLVGFAKNIFIGIPTLEQLIDLAIEREIDAGEEFELDENGGFTVPKLAQLALNALNASIVRDAQNRISFDDMVWLPATLGWVKARYDLVVIDECQDMNAPQLAIARGACKRGGRICIVGDDRQAIYAFRGADSNGMARMQAELNAAVLGLTTTYRCPKAVVKLAAEIVPDYNAAPSAPEGIVDEIDYEEILVDVQIGDVILSRLNAPLLPLCLSLLRSGTPARIEGRDIGAMLRAIVKKFNAKSVPDFLRKVYVWEQKKIARLAGAKKSFSHITDQAETLLAIAEGCANVREIDARLISLFADTEPGGAPCVVLSTVHKAKGLEFEHVFLLAATFRKFKGEQESNIYYVALTRAKNRLTFAE